MVKVTIVVVIIVKVTMVEANMVAMVVITMVEVTIVKDHQLERYSNDIVRWKIPTFWKSWPQLVYIQFLNLLSWV